MPESVTAYLRIPGDLKEGVDEFAASMPGRPNSEVLIELIRRGLRFAGAERRIGELISENNDARYRLVRCQTLVSEYYKQSNELARWFGAYRQVADLDPDKAREFLMAIVGAVGVFLAGKPDPRVIQHETGPDS
jgi:hypothetical protein